MKAIERGKRLRSGAKSQAKTSPEQDLERARCYEEMAEIVGESARDLSKELESALIAKNQGSARVTFYRTRLAECERNIRP